MGKRSLENEVLSIVRNSHNNLYPYKTMQYSADEIEKLVELFIEQKVLPIAEQKLTISGLSEQAKYELEKNRRMCDKSLCLLSQIIPAFNEAGIEFVVIKGIVLSQLLYGNHYSRITNDIDILVHEEDMEKADVVLRQLNFEQYNNYLESQTLDKPLYKYYNCHEFFPYRKQVEGEFVDVELARCLHWIRNKELVNKLFLYKEYIQIESVLIPTLTSAALIAEMIENIYENAESMYNVIFGGTTLSNYYDFVQLVKKYNISPNSIASSSEAFCIEEQTQKVFSYLKEIFYLEEFIEPVQQRMGFNLGTVIIPQMLNHSNQISEYLDNISNKIYSPENKFFNHISQENVTFHLNNDSRTAVAWFKRNENILLMDILINNCDLADLSKMMIEIKIYSNQAGSGVFCLTGLIYGEEGKCYICQNVLSDKYDNTYFIKGGKHKIMRNEITHTIDVLPNHLYVRGLLFQLDKICNYTNPVSLLAVEVVLAHMQDENIYFNDTPCINGTYDIPLIVV